MRIPLARLLLPLLLALAFVARWEPAHTLRLTDDEQRDIGGAEWLIDDPATCHEMRRIELAIAGNRVPTHDRFVNHPADGEIPAFALFDGFVAGVAQRMLRSPSGEAALGYVDERALEDFAVKLSPILGLFAVLATYWAARTIVDGKRGDIAVLVATAFAAFHPALIASSSAGVLDAAALSAIACALLVRSTVRSIRATAMPAGLLDALVAGALAGILVANSAVGLAVFAPAWIAFFVHARRSGGETRANALRSGVFFTVVAAFVARMSAAEESLDEGRIVAGYAAGVSLIVFFTAVPYLLLLLFERDKKASAFRTACFVVALVVMATQVPAAWGTVAPAVAWFTSNHGLLAKTTPEFTSHFLDVASAALMLATVGLAAWSWRRRADTAVLALGTFAVVLAVATAVTALAAPLWAVVVACALARVIDDEESPRYASFAAAAGIAIFLALALKSAVLRSDASLRQERLDFVAALRWMRANTESGGPWNSPRTPSAWGVLSNVADGPLVLYHARRPALASPWGTLSGPLPLRESSARLHENSDIDRLERWMQGQGARYVVVAGRAARREREPVSSEPASTGRSVADLLLDACASDPPSAPRGFALAYCSKRRVDPSGTTTLDAGLGRPVIAIFNRVGSDAETPRAEVRPR